MKTRKIKFEEFNEEKLTNPQLKTVHGGDDPIDPKDPSKGGGTGGTPQKLNTNNRI